MKVTHAVEIERGPESVFSWLDDPSRATTWIASVSRTEILHRTKGLVGTTFRETVADENGSIELEGVVTACRPNQEIAFLLSGPSNVAAVEYRLERVANGTRLTMVANIHSRGAVKVLSFITWPLFKQKVLGQVRRECAELTRLCESGQTHADEPSPRSLEVGTGGVHDDPQ